MWNFGYKSEVVEINPSKTGKTIAFMLRSFESGEIKPRKMGADRLVVVEPREPEKSKIDRAISERKNTYFGVYSDVGTALEKFTTKELAEYYLKRFGDGGLRYFLEQQIIAAEIAKEKAH